MPRAKKQPKPIEVDPMLPLRFVVEGRAVAWTPSRVTRNGTYKIHELCMWQEIVKGAAREAWGAGHEPYAGPVAVSIMIYLIEFGSTPDVTNCFKAIEDSLQGIVIANDRQVEFTRGRRVFTDQEFVVVTVSADRRMRETKADRYYGETCEP
jgi:Holliday junction resolvase RusA-like endonuclease